MWESVESDEDIQGMWRDKSFNVCECRSRGGEGLVVREVKVLG